MASGCLYFLKRPRLCVLLDVRVETLPVIQVADELVTPAAEDDQVRGVQFEFWVEVERLFVVNLQVLRDPARLALRVRGAHCLLDRRPM